MTSCERQALKFLLLMIMLPLGQSLHITTIDGCPRSTFHVPQFPETETKGTTLVEIRDVSNVSISPKTNQQFTGKLEVQKISKNDFNIKIKEKFDYESIHDSFLHYLINCQEGNNTDGIPTDLEFLVIVSNVFDNNITFSKQNYDFHIKEDAVKTDIGTVTIKTKEKDFQIGDIGWNEVSGILFYFKDPYNTGIGVTQTSILDYEKHHSYQFQLRVNHSTFVATTHITIYIIDIDDQDPKFTQNTYHLVIPENASTSYVATSSPPIAAFDQDTGINASISYKLTGGWPVNNTFIVLEHNASIKINQPLDRELVDTYVLIIEGHQASSNTFRKDVAQLVIKLSDVNDNPPKFLTNDYNVSIPENLANDSIVLRVTATDADEGDNAAFQYSIDQDKDAFQIESNTGEVRVLNDLLLDREVTERMQFKVIARETKTIERRSSSATVVVHLTDENDNSPIFKYTNYTFGPIYKNISVGSSIGQVFAVDKDIGSMNKEVRYKLSGYGSHRFFINNTAGEIKILQSLNVSFQRWYNFTVTAEDCAPLKQRRTSSVEVKIHVLDVNMNTPIIQNKNVKVNVSEDAQINTYITEFKASDADIDDIIRFSIVPDSHFVMDPLSGVVTLRNDLDREVCSMYSLTVYVSDGKHNDSTSLVIYIDDVNDNAPKFYGQTTFLIEEEMYPQQVGVMYANDTDSGKNSQLTYSIIGEWSEYLDITQSGSIKTSKPIDRESLMGSSDTIKAVVMVQDGGTPPLSGTATVTITVSDINDHAPVFPQPLVTVHTKEGISNNLFVAKATDQDGQGENGIVLYRITPNTNLTIEEDGGISTKRNLKYGNLTISITANNSNFYSNSSMKDGHQTLLVIVEDINDNRPQFRKEKHNFTVDENTTGKLTNSSSAVRAWDADPTQKFNTVYHSITAGNDDKKFRIDSITGDIYLDKPLDFEIRKIYQLTVTASDNHTVETVSHQISPIKFVKTSVTVHVRDVNDGVPTFTNDTIHCGLSENRTGNFNCSVKATDTDKGENGAITYAFQNTNDYFEIDNQKGIITCVKGLDYENVNQRRFQIRVLARDSGNPPQTGETLVFIEVMNRNDNKPKLESNFDFYIKENENKTEIGFIQATDDDGDHLTYTLQHNGALTGHRDFPITVITSSDSNWAVLKTTTAIDREQIKELSFTLIVNDTVHTTQSSVTVHVQDANDNAPQFDKSVYTTEIDENRTEMNLTVQASDQDFEQQNNEIAYVLEESEWLDFFKIYENGTIRLQKPFNREDLSNEDIPIYLTVTAKDNGSPQLMNSTVVMVTVKDVNDNAPMFTTDSVTLTFDEMSQPVDFYDANVTDEDINEENTKVIFKIVPSHFSDFSDFFRINSSTGLISATKKLTIPSTGIMNITIQASNAKPYVISTLLNATMQINIKVQDVNNHRPQFHGNFNFSIKENTRTGFWNRTIQAHDKDVLPEYSTITYKIGDGNYNGTFYIDSSTADLILLKPLDYETKQTFAITVSASDSQPSYRNHNIETSTTLVSIQVEDVNDITPRFSKEKYSCSVVENVIGKIHCNISAYDNEAPPNGGRLLYSLHGVDKNKFHVNNLTGEISTVNKIAFESQKNVYEMIIVASDFGSPTLRGSASVTIAITDVNNNAPQVHGKHNFTVNEGMPNNTVIGYITVTDKDHGSTFIYNIVKYTETGFDKSKRDSEHFYIRLDKSLPGILILRTTGEIDREQIQSISFKIQVNDSVNVVTHSVSVGVEDLNDNSPQFNSSVYKLKIKEGDINKTISVKATDGDATNPNNEINYIIKDSRWSGNFAIDNKGMVTLITPIDREQLSQSQIDLTVIANDNGSPMLETSSIIKITVVDINDYAPVFVENNATFIFDEDSTPIDFYTAKVIDNDATNENKKVRFEIMSDYSSFFTFNASTGVISALRPLVVTRKGYMEVSVKAFNVQPYVGNLKNTTIKVYIHIKDVNNHSPFFNLTYNFAIAENTPPGKLENRIITAYDEDTTPEFNTITYWISSGNVNNTFYLERSTGALFLMKPLDYEKRSNYNLTISASDMQPSSDGSGTRTSTTQVLIQVSDVNDNWPHFQKDLYNCKISENKIGGFGCSVHATDDADKPITYSFQNSSRFFSINKTTGEITCSKAIDYEKPQQRKFTIVLLATDQDKAKLTGTTTVKITVLNENDNEPKFSGKHQFSVEENQNNTVLGLIKATDEDGDKLHYSLISADFINDNRSKIIRSIDNFISLSSLASGYVMLTTTSPLDREEISMINCTIQVNDSRHVATHSVSVAVEDVNDHSPQFNSSEYKLTIKEGDVNKSLSVKATDGDTTAPNKKIIYIIKDSHWCDNFLISDQGEVTLMTPIDREQLSQSRINLTVVARNTGFPLLETSSIIQITVVDINDNAPVFVERNATFIFDEDATPLNFYTVKVIDSDATDENKKNRFEIISDYASFFAVNEFTGVLCGIKPLVVTKKGYMEISVKASNVQPYVGSLKNATMKFYIYIKGVNNHSPHFNETYSFSLAENSPLGKLENRNITAYDEDTTPEFNTITYWISSGNVNNTFYLERSTAALFLMKPLDYEKHSNFNLTISASDMQPFSDGSGTKTSTTQVLIHVTDVPDNRPQFQKDLYDCKIYENKTGGFGCFVKATDDADKPITYSFPNIHEFFNISETTGEITCSKRIDYEDPQHRIFEINVLATDHDTVALTGSTTVKITVLNENDNKPKFSGNYQFSVEENQNNTVLGFIKATDDDGDKLDFSLTSPDFIDNSRSMISGEIDHYVSLNLLASGDIMLTTRTPIDRERISMINFTIQVNDSMHVVKQRACINIQDINDNSPQFDYIPVNITIDEDNTNNNFLVQAKDQDATEPNNQISYRILHPWSDFFAIDDEGNITQFKPIDREKINVDTIYVTVIATDHGTSPLVNSAVVVVIVNDVNDNDPAFDAENMTFIFDEGSKPKDFYIAHVIDKDATAKNRDVVFDFLTVPSTFANYFTISNATGALSALKPLDIPPDGYIILSLKVRNVQKQTKSAKMNIFIYVQDNKKHFPKFVKDYYFSVPENTSTGILNLDESIQAHDEDKSAHHPTIYYEVTGGNRDDTFYLDSVTADLFLLRHLDFETSKWFDLTISATNQHSVNRKNETATTHVFINITDVNDKVPKFKKEHYTCYVEENFNGTIPSCNIEAVDDENFPNGGRLSYSLQEHKNMFQIDHEHVTLRSSLDYETQNTSYIFVLYATDFGTPPLTGSTTVVVRVLDVNDNYPIFQNLENFAVDEELPNNTYLGFIKAIDKDNNDELSYRLIENTDFWISKGNGELFTNRIFDYEKADKSFTIKIEVTDSIGHSNNASINIIINNVNDNEPEFSRKTYSRKVKENSRKNEMILKVNASDADHLGNLSYSILNRHDMFTICNSSGNIYVSGELDYENTQHYSLLVEVRDDEIPYLKDLTLVMITVVNVNDNPPEFLSYDYDGAISENNHIGSEILQVYAEDVDSLTSSLIFNVENYTDIFNFVNNTLTSIVSLDSEEETNYYVNISVSDGSYEDFSVVHVKVIDENDNIPQFVDCADAKCSFNATIPYSAENHTRLIKINVTDKDVTNTGVTFYLTNTDDIFIINNKTGDVYYQSNERHKLVLNTSYDIQVHVFDHGSPPKSNKVSIRVYIDTSNLNAPMFDNRTYYASLYENATISQNVLTVSATDNDAGLAGTVRYDIDQITPASSDLFLINVSTGEIRLNGTLDFEQIKQYKLIIRARDLADDSRSSSTTVKISIENVNEAPKFVRVSSTVCTVGNFSSGMTVAIVEVKDEPGKLTFTLLHHNDAFTIVPESEASLLHRASIKTKTVIQSTEIGEITLNINASDSGGLYDITQLKLQSGNIGNPVFQPSFMSVNVEENKNPTPYVIVDVNTTTENTSNDVVYSLVKNAVGKEFNIDSKTGILMSNVGFPWKRGNTSFTIQVNAENSHGNCSTFVTVHIIDKNDHKPVFIDCCDDPLKIREMNITSQNPSISCVKNITASDEDEYENLNITIGNYNSLIPFGIHQENKDSACLIITASIDFDLLSVHAYILELTVSDGHLNTSRNLTIQIEDVNDNYPTFAEYPYLINVTEDRSVNSEVSVMSATDVDTMDNNKIRYALEPSKGSPFTIDSVNGVAILKLSSRLDYEERSVYNLTITATDTGNQSTAAPIYVSVLDSNDNRPVFENQTYKFWQPEGKESLNFRKEIQVTDADHGKNGEVSFEISSGNVGNHFNVTTSNNTATIFIQKQLDRENTLLTKTDGVGMYTLLIVAKDEGFPSLSASATVLVFVTDINDCVPEFSQKKYEYEIIEAAPPDVPVFTVSASDCDYKPHINYTLIGETNDDFRINQEGQIFPIKSISYGKPYEVEVCASDGKHFNTTTVIFNVTDVNDHDPEFSHKIYTFRIPENDNEDSKKNLVGLVSASDNDTGRNGNVTYRIISTDVSKLFKISEESGRIETIGKLDRDTCANTRYTFTVIAVDHGISQRTGFTEVVVSISDVNDNRPLFSEDKYDGRIHENAEIDTEVIVQPVIRATDIDKGMNGTKGIVFSLDGEGQSLFRIDRTGRVFVNGMHLDRETRDTYRLEVFARDQNGTGLIGNTTLIIHITDENDQTPVFEENIYNIEAFENVTDSALIGKVTATDQDINGNKTIRYTITQGSTGKFFIDRQQGYIYVNGGLDREKRGHFMLNITASDGINENHTIVNITVLDCNDNYPLFHPPLIKINITENGIENVTVKNISATDDDEGENGFVSYFTNDTRSAHVFNVTRNGKITVLTSLDREKNDTYMFYVYAKDHGNPMHVSRATVQVTVKDVNDNHPLFYDEYDENQQICNKTVSVLEKSPVNSPVAWPHVKDQDSGVNKEFSFTLFGKGHEYFKIDPKTGIVTIKDKIDRNILMHEDISNETTLNTSVISLYISATDKGDPPLSSVLKLSVIVVGINDDAPTFNNPSYEFDIPENATKESFVGKVQALSNANFTFLKYTIINESNAATVFKIHPEKGSITLQTSLDREQRNTYSFAVRVTDGKIPERTAFTVVKVTVADINDNSPEFKEEIFVFSLEENYPLIPSEFITATDKDVGRNAVLHYSLLNATESLFTINTTTSQLYLNGSLDREETPFISFIVQATDNGDPPLSSNARVQIIVQDENDNSPVFQQSEYISNVLENTPPGTKVLQVSANDADEGLNGTVIYSLGNDSQPFFVEAMSGILRTVGDIDYEIQEQYNFIVEARDLAQNFKASTANITVIVIDVNDTDTVPRFNKTVYTAILSPLTQANVSVLLVDAGSDVRYTITESNGPFGIEADTGSIMLEEQLNGLRKDYVLLVQAVSIHQPNCLDTAVVVIHVQDQMYASFPIKKYSVSVEENTLHNTELIDLNTTQEDNGQTVLYNLIPVPCDDDFKIDSKTGKITVSGTFDREKTEQYVLHVYAAIKETSYLNRSKRSIDDNEANVAKLQRNEAIVIVTIGDVDDNSPSFDLQGRQNLMFYIPKTLEAGDPVVNITAHDPDSSSHVVYRLMNNVGEPSTVFYIETRTGEIRTLTRLSQLQSNEYVLNVTATDQVNPSTHVTVKMILIPASSTLIFVAPLTPAEFIQNKEHLLGNMSNILGLNVHLEKVRPHIQGKFVDEKKSDLYLFATDNRTGKVQSKETLTNGITSNIEAIRNLFKCINSDSACVIITEPVAHTPYSWSAAEIALLVIASIILIATVIGIIILRHIWKQMDEAKQREVQMFELQSKHSNDSNYPFEILNPTYDETTFEKEIESVAGNIVDIESQERVVIFGPELQLNGVDSGVENDSSSSNNDSTEADGLAKEGSSSEQDNPVALGNLPDAESVSSAPSTHRDSVIGSSAHSSIADVRELQLHRSCDQLSTVEVSQSNTESEVHTSMIIIDMDTGDTDDSEVILDNTASDNEGVTISQSIINFDSVTNTMNGESKNHDEIVVEDVKSRKKEEKSVTSEKIETLNVESDLQRGPSAAKLPEDSVNVSINTAVDVSEEQTREWEEEDDLDTQL